MVSTVAASLVADLGLEIESLDGLISVQGAGGHILEYRGYIAVSTQFPGLGEATTQSLFLVVPDTAYHQQVPVLIGTNILNSQLTEVGVKDLPLPWKFALQSLIGQKKIEARSGSLGVVTTTKGVTIQPEQRVTVSGLTRAAAGACLTISVMADEPKDSPLPGSLVVSPCLFNLKPGVSTERVAVEITNFSSRAVTIPAKTNFVTCTR